MFHGQCYEMHWKAKVCRGAGGLLSVMVKRRTLLWVEISLRVFVVNVCKDDYCFVMFFEVD